MLGYSVWVVFTLCVVSAVMWSLVLVFRHSIPRDLLRALFLLWLAVVLVITSYWYGMSMTVRPAGVVSAVVPTNLTLMSVVNGSTTYVTYSVNATYVTTAYMPTPYGRWAVMGFAGALILVIFAIYFIIRYYMGEWVR